MKQKEERRPNEGDIFFKQGVLSQRVSHKSPDLLLLLLREIEFLHFFTVHEEEFTSLIWICL